MSKRKDCTLPYRLTGECSYVDDHSEEDKIRVICIKPFFKRCPADKIIECSKYW